MIIVIHPNECQCRHYDKNLTMSFIAVDTLFLHACRYCMKLISIPGKKIKRSQPGTIARLYKKNPKLMEINDYWWRYHKKYL